MFDYGKYIGLDVHKETIAVAVADTVVEQPRFLGEIANTPEAVRKLVKRLRSDGERMVFCYEAGPCGYGLYRQLRSLGEECVVVAPSLIPRKASDRVKTDRRDWRVSCQPTPRRPTHCGVGPRQGAGGHAGSDASARGHEGS